MTYNQKKYSQKNKIGKKNAIDFYNNKLEKKAEQISKLRSTQPKQKMLEIFNYLREIFNEPKQMINNQTLQTCLI